MSVKIDFMFVFACLLQLRDASVGHLTLTGLRHKSPITGSNGMIAIISRTQVVVRLLSYI